jgi:hypothetical protein
LVERRTVAYEADEAVYSTPPHFAVTRASSSHWFDSGLRDLFFVLVCSRARNPYPPAEHQRFWDFWTTSACKSVALTVTIQLYHCHNTTLFQYPASHSASPFFLAAGKVACYESPKHFLRREPERDALEIASTGNAFYRNSMSPIHWPLTIIHTKAATAAVQNQKPTINFH